ncbi:uncharacterized protein LOC126915692 isoform X4 [Bombus affinis]|nr:uncharacterized protein LOC126915692 isoform X4 [Bombus affinis]XP_050576548.1 uncharacterized protein LOC126915692 isoform X4 [Bombus affinis]XP_050576549.1 uncharacterized protein LOC126915692 isoform X4 [Bombus affinis]XP_050576550.1 uncharacterized protein LOC126915692 isoform X4 [Bombus affinis]XP_050576551.1 uncharacterized protein LOC126915692 isoform X4 [Bombus affinis]XP_050576552.1 uncharacterized protein LOC126915692 isoform X4 [Bombus affinis]XP_050576553.1 uncharacterized prot
MDFNGNVYADEQRNRSEESRQGTFDDNDIEKIQQLTNEKKRKQGTGPIRSNESVKNGGERDFHRNQQYRRGNQQRENYAKMYEHRKDSSYQGTCPDRNTSNFTGENIWQNGNPNLSYDNYGNAVIEYDANRANDAYRNCKSGINISVVSRQPTCENVGMEKPVYNVSFKHCYNNTNQRSDQKRRRFFSRSKPKSGKKSKQIAGNPHNYRCTFENCCGNCEPYAVKRQDDDCGSCKKWQNTDLSSKNECFDDCYCPLDVNSQQPCVVYEENEPKCDFPPDDCHASSKQCLQRVHFAGTENCARTDHSSCSFCSRKCTPSKASLFVEIGESVANVSNLTSAQAFQCDDSMGLLKDDAPRKEYSAVKRNKSDLLRCRSKSKKSEPKCSSSCKGRPGAVERTCSDRIASMSMYLDDYTIEQMPEEPFSPEMIGIVQSNVSFQDLRDCKAQTESDMYIKRKTTGCSQQCETDERSLLDDIRKQVQETYKCFVKMVTTSIGQIVKQSSKLKRSKKSTKDRSTCGTCMKNCEENTCANQCNQSKMYDECMYEGTCWQGIIGQESNNCDMHCCGNVCCDGLAGLPECQTPMCRIQHLSSDDCWKPNCDTQEQIQSERECYFDPSRNAHRNVYPPNKAAPKEIPCPKHSSVRKKGGGDTSNQQKKQPTLNKRSEPSGVYNRENISTKSQVTKQQNQATSQFIPQDQQTDRTNIQLDVSVQANSIRAVFDPTTAPYITESIEYHKRIRTANRLEPYADERRGPPQRKECPRIQEIESTLHSSSKENLKTPKKSVASSKKKGSSNSVTPKQAPASLNLRQPFTPGKPEVSARTGVSTPRKDVQRDVVKQERMRSKCTVIGKGVQCTLIREVRVICSTVPEVTGPVADLCSCIPKKGMVRPDKPPSKISQMGEESPPATDVTMDAPDATMDVPDTTVDIPDATVDVSDATVNAPDATVNKSDATVNAPDVILNASNVTVEPNVEEPVEENAPVVQSSIETPFIDEDETTVDATDGPTDSEATHTDTPAIETTTAESSTEEAPARNLEVLETSNVTETAEVPIPDESTIYEAAMDTPKKPEEELIVAPIVDEVTDVDNREAPIEFSKDFNGKKMYVSVQMQTSNTILTQILSEFQVGNKKRQVLMSIKLHSNLDGNGEDEQQSSGSNGSEVAAAERQSPRYDNHDYQRRIRRVTVSPSVYRRTLTTRGTYDSSTYASVNQATYERTETNYSPENENSTTNGTNHVCGPCGKKRR